MGHLRAICTGDGGRPTDDWVVWRCGARRRASSAPSKVDRLAVKANMCEQTGPAIPARQGFYTKMCRFSVLHLTYSTCTMIDACCDMSRSDWQMSRPMISIMCVSTYVCLSASASRGYACRLHVLVYSSFLPGWVAPHRRTGAMRTGSAPERSRQESYNLTAVSTKSRTLQSLWNSIPGVPSVLWPSAVEWEPVWRPRPPLQRIASGGVAGVAVEHCRVH